MPLGAALAAGGACMPLFCTHSTQLHSTRAAPCTPAACRAHLRSAPASARRPQSCTPRARRVPHEKRRGAGPAARDAIAFLLGSGAFWGTRRVRLVRGEGRGVSDQYGVRDAACPISTRGWGWGGVVKPPRHRSGGSWCRRGRARGARGTEPAFALPGQTPAARAGASAARPRARSLARAPRAPRALWAVRCSEQRRWAPGAARLCGEPPPRALPLRALPFPVTAPLVQGTCLFETALRAAVLGPHVDLRTKAPPPRRAPPRVSTAACAREGG
jgi:hypothetical protein